MAKQKTYTFWGSNPEKGNRFDKAEEWIAAVFEDEESRDKFEASEGKNYKYTEKSIYDIRSGLRVASGFHSARIFCEGMSENKAKKELENLNTRCSAYFKKPVKGGSYVKFNKDGFVEGSGYSFYSNEDNKINETKTTMKHVKLFEQFVNERFNSRRAAKELEALGFKNVDGSDGEISVETAEMDNPFGHDAAFTFFWNGKDVWAEAEDGSYVEQTQEIETVEQFADCMQFGEGWA